MEHRKLPRGDGGFSLVELLVAIAILGVITIPLLHAFLTSTDTAAKSRTLGEETLAAQNVAEKVEGTALGSLSDLGPVTAYDGGTPPNILTDPSQPAAEYDLSISAGDMGRVGVSGGRYSAKVKLTGADEKEGTVYTPMDAVFMQTGGGIDPDDEAADEFRAQAQEITDGTPSFQTTRAIDILIDEKSGGAYEYSCSFRYNCTIGYTDDTGAARTAKLSPVSYPYVFYDGTYDAGKQNSLAALYFFFSPYAPAGGPMYDDTITITHNTANAAYAPVPVFLAKQGTSDPGYKLLVQLKGNADDNAQNTTVYCNVPSADAVFRIFQKEGVWYETAPQSFGSLVATERQYRRYDMTVELYDDKNNRVYTLTGSKLG